jgi:formylglycine-generating enzyme required for sulfatase activity
VLRRDASGAPFVGTTTLTFQFSKAGASACSVTTAPIVFTEAMGGAFTVEVPIGTPCPPQLFDGSDVTYSVQQDLPTPTVVATGVTVTPVPYARFADQAGVSNDCPAGYLRDTAAAPGIVCARTVTLGGMPLRDEVVKVGTGGSAFWVDRYEASVHATSTGVQLAVSNASAGVDGLAVETSGLTVSGQRPAGDGPARAYSHPGYPTVNLTWFQANEACRASGKRLLTREEWFAAASGTVDGPLCNVSTAGARPSATGNGCVSASGAHDMIGNVWEVTAEWYASVGQITSPAQSTVGAAVVGIRVNNSQPAWPADHGSDGTWNVTSVVSNGMDNQIGVPAVAFRGGSWSAGGRGGTFALDLTTGPSARAVSVGFRCVVPR